MPPLYSTSFTANIAARGSLKCGSSFGLGHSYEVPEANFDAGDRDDTARAGETRAPVTPRRGRPGA
jgi:hypothetical protein